jgi:hypothetical protein
LGIHFTFGGMTYQKALKALCLLVECGELDQLSLDFLKFRQGVEKKAFIETDSQYDLVIAAIT